MIEKSNGTYTPMKLIRKLVFHESGEIFQLCVRVREKEGKGRNGAGCVLCCAMSVAMDRAAIDVI